jgi:hypothetical protein
MGLGEKGYEDVGYYYIIISGVRLSSLGTAATTDLLYHPQMIDDDDEECGAVGGMIIGRGNRSTRIKPAAAPLCPPLIPYDHTRARTRPGKPETNRLSYGTAQDVGYIHQTDRKKYKTYYPNSACF